MSRDETTDAALRGPSVAEQKGCPALQASAGRKMYATKVECAP